MLGRASARNLQLAILAERLNSAVETDPIDLLRKLPTRGIYEPPHLRSSRMLGSPFIGVASIVHFDVRFCGRDLFANRRS